MPRSNVTITLYTTSECSLCHSLKADLVALQPKIGFVLVEHNIDVETGAVSGDDSEYWARMERYRALVPVLDIENGAMLYSPFSYDELFDAIDAAVMSLTCSENSD